MKKILSLLAVCSFMACSFIFTACTANTPASNPTVQPSAEVNGTLSASAEPTAMPSIEPVLEEYEYTYTPYIISDINKTVFSEEVIALAEDIINAYIAYETSVPAPSERTMQEAFAVAVRSFPPFDAFTTYNEYTAFKDGKATWKLDQTKEEHEAMLVEFQEVVESYMKVLKKGDSETARALALYKELLTDSAYDHSFEGTLLDYSPIELTAYYFLFNRTGICTSYSSAYSYLLLQAGIDASNVGGSDQYLVDGYLSSPHDWVIMKLDGKYFFADPTWEQSHNELAWFGLTREYRESEWGGYFVPDLMSICGYGKLDAFDLSDTRFSEFHTPYGESALTGWEFNSDRSAILYKDFAEETHTFNIK